MRNVGAKLYLFLYITNSFHMSTKAASESSSRIRAFTKMARKRKATGAECAGKCYYSCITPSEPHSPVSQGPEDEERGLLVHRGCFKP